MELNIAEQTAQDSLAQNPSSTSCWHKLR